MINRLAIVVAGLLCFYLYVCFVFGLAAGAFNDKIDITIGIVILTILPIVIIVMIILEIWDWIKG